MKLWQRAGGQVQGHTHPLAHPPGISIQRADALLKRQQALVDLCALQPRLLVVIKCVCTNRVRGGRSNKRHRVAKNRITLQCPPACTSATLCKRPGMAVHTCATLAARKVNEGQLPHCFHWLSLGAQSKAEDGV